MAEEKVRLRDIHFTHLTIEVVELRLKRKLEIKEKDPSKNELLAHLFIEDKIVAKQVYVDLLLKSIGRFRGPHRTGSLRDCEKLVLFALRQHLITLEKAFLEEYS